MPTRSARTGTTSSTTTARRSSGCSSTSSRRLFRAADPHRDRPRRHRRSVVRPPGRHFHGYYDSYCYLPLYIFCGRHLLAAKLRRANIDASAGAIEEIERIAGHIRTRWPKVGILLRADSGFAREALMTWCEANDIDYLFGLAKNDRLIGEIAAELAAAAKDSEQSGKPARRFKDFSYKTLSSWSCERRVIGKAEWMTPSLAESDDMSMRAKAK